jgi:hypothetical protein
MKLPDGLTPAEIRVLQEFRRFKKKEMTLDQIKAIKHPVGGGEAPALSLVEKGYLTQDQNGTTFTLTEKPTELLSYDPLPISERG